MNFVYWLFSYNLGIEPRAFYLLSKCSNSKPQSQP